jgi:hypothetical protein
MQGVLDALSNAVDTPRVVLVPRTTRLTSFEIVLASKLPLDAVDPWADTETQRHSGPYSRLDGGSAGEQLRLIVQTDLRQVIRWRRLTCVERG